MVAGCAYIDQNLQVTPQMSISSINVGQGQKIALRVVDDRDEELIGKRHDGYGLSGAKISTQQDLVTVVKTFISDGFSKKGFEVVAEGESGVFVKVELRTLGYENSTGLWTAGNIGKAVVKVNVTHPSGKSYEKSYRSQKEIRTAFVASQETNAKVINGALSDALNKIFEDDELLHFLAQ